MPFQVPISYEANKSDSESVRHVWVNILWQIQTLIDCGVKWHFICSLSVRLSTTFSRIPTLASQPFKQEHYLVMHGVCSNEINSYPD